MTAPITAGPARSAGTTPQRIVFVCHANQGRSPFAANLLERLLVDLSPQPDRYVVTSAGLEAVTESIVLPHIRTAAAELGIDLTSHRARLLDADAVTSNHLIITMTEDQRGAVSRMQPRALAKTFTLKEIVRLGDALVLARDAAHLDDVAHTMHRSRPMVAAAPEAEDVRDPATLNAPATLGVVAEIDQLVRAVAQLVVGRTTSSERAVS